MITFKSPDGKVLWLKGPRTDEPVEVVHLHVRGNHTPWTDEHFDTTVEISNTNMHVLKAVFEKAKRKGMPRIERRARELLRSSQ